LSVLTYPVLSAEEPFRADIVAMFPGEDKSLLERLEELQKRFNAVGELTDQTDRLTEKTSLDTARGIENVTQAEEVIEKAFESFKVSCTT
jgi:hypothetical protein